MIPQIMAEFSEKYPNVNVSIWEEAYSIQEKLLLNDQLDFGIFNETREHPKLEYELLKREKILLVMPPDHPLASSGYPSPSDRYPRIDLSTLASEPFILHFRNRPPENWFLKPWIAPVSSPVYRFEAGTRRPV